MVHRSTQIAPVALSYRRSYIRSLRVNDLPGRKIQYVLSRVLVAIVFTLAFWTLPATHVKGHLLGHVATARTLDYVWLNSYISDMDTQPNKRKKGEYIGHTFGRFTVIKCIEPTQGFANRGGLWLCKCSCGNEFELRGHKMQYRNSCGCLVKEGRLKQGSKARRYDTVTVNAEYGIYRGNTKQRGFEPLAKEDWYKIVTQPCHYCGEIDTRNRTNGDNYKRTNGKSLTPEQAEKYAVKINGVDRVNSKLGYEAGNIVPCCGTCNRMKNGYSVEVFFDKIKKIYERHC